MYLSQTHLQADLNNVRNHANGQEIIMMAKTESQPNSNWFVFKADFEKYGRDCIIYRARIKNNVVTN